MKTRRLLFLFLIQLFSFVGFGQHSEIESLVQEGIELHDKGEYQKAINWLNEHPEEFERFKTWMNE